MNEVLGMIKNFIEGRIDPVEFSVMLPDILIQKYDEMLIDNKELTELLNDNLPEICAEYETGMDSKEFINAVQEEYDKALKFT